MDALSSLSSNEAGTQNKTEYVQKDLGFKRTPGDFENYFRTLIEQVNNNRSKLKTARSETKHKPSPNMLIYQPLTIQGNVFNGNTTIVLNQSASGRKSSAEFMRRNKSFLEQKELKINRLKEQAFVDEVKDCTFKPSLITQKSSRPTSEMRSNSASRLDTSRRSGVRSRQQFV